MIRRIETYVFADVARYKLTKKSAISCRLFICGYAVLRKQRKVGKQREEKRVGENCIE